MCCQKFYAKNQLLQRMLSLSIDITKPTLQCTESLSNFKHKKLKFMTLLHFERITNSVLLDLLPSLSPETYGFHLKLRCNRRHGCDSSGVLGYCVVVGCHSCHGHGGYGCCFCHRCSRHSCHVDVSGVLVLPGNWWTVEICEF